MKAGLRARIAAPSFAASALAVLSVAAAAQDVAPTDLLLTVERSREAIVERIVEVQQPGLAQGAADALRARLWSARADRLLGASFARTAKELDGALGDAQDLSLAARTHAKAIGDATADLVYTPVTPCRIVDTRATAAGTLKANTARTFDGFAASSFAAQGGTASNCGMPNGVAAIAMNVYAVNPTALGFIKVWGANQSEPAVSTVNYQTGTVAIATGTIVPVDAANSNRFTAKSPTPVDFVADVVGYFAKPIGTPYKQGGNAFGATGTLGTTDAQALEIVQGNKRVVRFESGADAVFGNPTNIIAGSPGNSAAAGTSGVVIAGGGCNSGSQCSVSNINKALEDFGAIGGGNTNTTWYYAVVGGGFGNYAAGSYSVVPGGSNNLAYGAHSFAAGYGATAQTSPAAGNVPSHGAFVWADSNNNATSPDVFYTAAVDEFAARARGGFRFRTSGGDGSASGCNLPAGSAAWSCSSDRNAKRDFASVEGSDVLEKVLAMPISTWRFNGNAARHMGPMAQDFWAAFGLGDGDTTISHVDVQGVTLAAIQGLHAQIAERDRRIDELEQRVAALREEERRIDVLRADVEALRAALGAPPARE